MRSTIDWDSLTAEAVDLLSAYLRIDTSNPPGNEARATSFLRTLLGAAGIDSAVVEAVPGRANLFARIGPSGRTVLLLNHTDVVPAEPEFWDRPPFSGEVDRTSVWGRGALDMKGMAILQLMVMVLLKRLDVPLRRGVAFLATADEEAGSEAGAAWLAEQRPEWLACDFAITEGAYGVQDAGAVAPAVFQVAVGEKTPVWVKLTARGRPGHASVPHGDNAAARLVRALGRIDAWQGELRAVPVMRDHLAALARAHLVRPNEPLSRLAARGPGLAARLRDTISLTTLDGGLKVNVIPSHATATLDCRLLPDTAPEAFVRHLRKVIDDDRIEVEVTNRQYQGRVESMDHEFVSVVRQVVADLVEGAIVVPEMTSGFTDSRILRARGVTSFGFVPCLLEPGLLSTIHGHNERMPIDALRLGLQILFEVVRRIATS